jgi:hypothetical protein
VAVTELELHVRVGQQANIVQQALRRNRPRTAVFTFAGTVERIPNSRSVAVTVSSSPAASISTFDRIGIVVFFSTTPCDRFNSRTRSDLLIVNSMTC